MMTPEDSVKAAHEVTAFFTFASMAGGFLRGMIRVVGVVGSPAPYTRSDIVKASIDAFCALVSAFIAALFVSPGVVSWFKVTDVHLAGIIYFAIGLVFWQVAPFVVQVLVKAIPDILTAFMAARGASIQTEEPK